MRKAFTLIELLIVVAIIAILAAIAVPNFLEAQVRSKISRARADMRSVATAIEAYAVDHNMYPPDGSTDAHRTANYWDFWHLNWTLTTPIGYISTVDQMVDPFNEQESLTFARTYRYICTENTWGTKYGRLSSPSSARSLINNIYAGQWAMMSDGPDKLFGPAGANTSSASYPPGFSTSSWRPEDGYTGWPIPYDPTNGTVSWGDIQRTQRNPESAGNN